MLENTFEENGLIGELYRHNERDHEVVIYQKDKPENRVSEKYTCQYPALFGRDWSDSEELEKITDRLLNNFIRM
jgi:hypothetical protein